MGKTGPKIRTTEQIVVQARAVHGDRYDYSQTVYVHSTHKMAIKCRVHGEFWQEANSHLSGRGCPACGIAVAAATQIAKMERVAANFVDRSRAVHGDRYDYSKAEYKKAGDKVLIVCPEHGEFWQPAIQHMRGAACRACVYDRFRTEQETFITESHRVHGTKYDYSGTVYNSAKKAVRIRCPEHGEFQQLPMSHLKGLGCRKCYLARVFAPRPDQFIENARRIHGDKFDYSLVEYKTTASKVKIICSKHGAFEQKPVIHLRTTGCPMCGQEVVKAAARLDWIERASGRAPTLYFLRIFSEDEVFYKVGVTFVSVVERYRRAKKALAGYQYEVLAQHASSNAGAVYDWEQSILETFSHLAYTPKQHFGGATECFSSADEILSIFPL